MSLNVLLDVNVLVAVLRQDSMHHSAAITWCEQAQTGQGSILVLTESLVGAVRVLASHRIWAEPTPPPEAVRALDEFVLAMDARIIGADITAWRQFGRVASAWPLTSRMVPDALLVAAALSCRATLVTFDRGLSTYGDERVVILT